MRLGELSRHHERGAVKPRTWREECMCELMKVDPSICQPIRLADDTTAVEHLQSNRLRQVSWITPESSQGVASFFCDCMFP